MTAVLGQCATQTPPTSQGVSYLLARGRAEWSGSAFWKPVPSVEEQPRENLLTEAIVAEERPVEAFVEERRPISVVEVEPFSRTLKQVYELRNLSAGWDGAGAVAPSQASVNTALDWLNSCYAQCKDVGLDWPWVNVTAGLDGEVVLEWWGRTRSLIVSVDEESEEERGVRYHFSERSSGTPTRHTHGQASEPKELVGLLQWLVGK